MKRALDMALGAMVIAGSAAPATAASMVDFSGYYRAYFLNDTNLGKRGDNDSRTPSFTDSYFGHRLHLDVTFSPTDELSVYWRLRGPNFQRWGDSSSMTAETYHVYGQIKQDWGTVLVGRLDEDLDVYGLATLGWAPETNPIFTTVGPFEEASVQDGIRYSREWDNGFSLMAQYAKVSNNDNAAIWASDQDYDRFQAEGAYQWDGGGVSLNLIYDRDATLYSSPEDPEEPVIDKGNYFYVNPAFGQSWGDFGIHFEGLAGWGKEKYNVGGQPDVDLSGYGFYLDADYNYGPGNVNLAGWWVSGSDFDATESKSLVNMGGNFFPLIVAYNENANGNGRYSAVDAEVLGYSANAVSFANNAYVNYIHVAYQHTPNYLNTDNSIGGLTSRARGVNSLPFTQDLQRIEGNFGEFNLETEANHWALAVSGNHALTDEISLHYAVAYLALVNPNYRIADSWTGLRNADGTLIPDGRVTFIEQDKDLGWEIDLGFSFQLLDNLEFTTAFGYMFNGDAFKTLKGFNETGSGGTGADAYTNGQAVWEDPEDSYAWYNTLTFSF
ncbi:MAG: hypothetical protein LBS31_04735 [Candidatus Adiutrix sp.]|jgi:hypothetical protein|nr:hypothetical protein [Candidatus Adiutrix sp.]